MLRPDQELRASEPVVRQYPQFFQRPGDSEARAACFAALSAEQAAERNRQAAEEQSRRERLRSKVAKLADRLEAEERRRRKAEKVNARDVARETAEERARRVAEEERRLEEEHVRRLAEAEVARRLAAEDA